MRLVNTSAATVALILLATSACKKEPPAAEPPPPPPPAEPVAVSSIDLGKSIGPDKRVVAAMSEFGTRDTIYVSVSTTGTSAGTPVTAKWTYHGSATETVTVDSTTLSLSPTGPTVTEFHILNTSAWPKGKYKVTILVNGAPAKDKEFEVK